MRPELEEDMLEFYRRMTPQEKATRVFALIDETRRQAADRIRNQHPELTDREVLVRVAGLAYGRELVLRATGMDPGPEYDRMER
jgi:hypothetical protein